MKHIKSLKKFNEYPIFVFYFLCFVLLIFSTFFTACDNGATKKMVYTKYFNCPIAIESFSNKISTKTKKEIENNLSNIENSVSISKESSFVYKFNNLKANESIVLDEIVTDILEIALGDENSLYSLSSEKFNVAVYPLKELWQNRNENIIKGIVKPSVEEIENTKRLCELENVLTFDKENKTLTKLIDGAKIDLGGIAKGYAIEKIKTLLENDGVIDGYITFGSSSIYIFDAPSLSINHPRKEGNIVKIDNLKNTSISTSGDYQRIFGEDESGRIYSHIFDTKKGEPANTGVISATVIGDNGAILDGLSTSLMLCEFDFKNKENCELTNFINALSTKFSNYKFFVCYNKGQEKYLITNENKSNFSLLDNEYVVVNI